MRISLPIGGVVLGWGKLGRDFWLFRIGQVISVLGDACGSIALAWWILEATGSAAQMSAVIAPAMFVRIFLIPLFGPLGDKFDRKSLIFISEIWRCVCYGAISYLAFTGNFNLTLVIVLYILSSIGSAIFESVSTSIVPQIVAKEHLQIAMRQNQAIDSIGHIVGGVAGGFLVTFAGIAGAFAIDGLTFLVSGILTVFMVSKTIPEQSEESSKRNALVTWFVDLKSGFRILYKIKVMFWLAVVAMLLNFAASPLGVVLPVLVKEARNMPPWFLGALQSSVSAGAILGSLMVGWLARRFLQDRIVVAGIASIGIGVGLMPWVPNAALPLVLMFVIGAGSAIANILMSTQEAIATPDRYRSRINSIMAFMAMLASPIGVAIAGYMIEQVGLTTSLLLMGGLVVIFSPLMFLIPHFADFMRADHATAETFFTDNYDLQEQNTVERAF